MAFFIKPLLLVVFAALGLFGPELAFAQNANPPGLTDWELYVYGNGRVVYDILMGIKMLMVPEAGETGFVTLLLLMATVGFVVLAIAAGFDPGKNLLRMFTYILVVWLVVFGTTKLTANVVIIDMARSHETGAHANPEYRVTRAPALVVLPAALTSTVGNYFTRVIETYFSMPGEFKLSGQAVGQFNLFGRMMTEAGQYVITSPELKRSLSAYTADCVVPAMALGKLMGPVKGPDGETVTASGTEALLRTTDMTATLASAQNRGVLTRYYPFSLQDTRWMEGVEQETGDLSVDEGSLARYSSTGVLMSCTYAWDRITLDMENHTELLVKAGSEAWSKAGVMVPFETAMTTMLSQAAGPGGVVGANFSRPSGFIMQQAMVNSMNGSFRQAAIQTGNNELMQAAALSQAEQQQKSSWAASFQVFNNMMGYVFTVLQAFIFALTPLIVIALMVPGLGKSIFVNYAQVLIWLTLWQPMLALINFIITLFASESLSWVVQAEGGLSVTNKALISEKTNDLMIAAGFLGTMTPLLSWGIVKGAMAFTEFISKGVGSEFASQAGASAATGNMSMNNLSLDNTSMNKYSTAMSSQVGAQGVSTGANSGAMSLSQDAGGSDMRMNSAGVNLAHQKAEQLSQALSESKAIGQALSSMKNESHSLSSLQSMAADSSRTAAEQKAAQMVLSAMEAAGMSSGTGKTDTNANSVNQGDSTTAGQEASKSSQVAAQGSAGLGLGVVGANISGSATTGNNLSEGARQEAGSSHNATSTTSLESDKFSASHSASQGNSFTTSQTDGTSRSASQRAAMDEQTSVQNAVSSAISQNDSITSQLSSMQSVSSSFGYNDGMSMAEFNQQLQAFDAMRSDFSSAAAGMSARASDMSGGLTSSVQQTSGAIAAADSANRAALGGMSNFGTVAQDTVSPVVGGRMEASRSAINAATEQVQGERARLEGAVSDAKSNNAASGIKDTPTPLNLQQARAPGQTGGSTTSVEQRLETMFNKVAPNSN